MRCLAPTATAESGDAVVDATVVKSEFIGPLVRVDLTLADGHPVKVAMLDTPDARFDPGNPVRLAFDPARASLFPVEAA
jgi:hypothetical protein